MSDKGKAASPGERETKPDSLAALPVRSPMEFRNEAAIRPNLTEIPRVIEARELPPIPPLTTERDVPNAKSLIQHGTAERAQPEGIGKTVEEKKPMRRKWFGLGQKTEVQDDSPGIARELPNAQALITPARPAEANSEPDQTTDSDGVDLLSMNDIYQTAGIRGPLAAQPGRSGSREATFGNWLTLKQQESANITEALQLCTKSTVAEPAKTESIPP